MENPKSFNMTLKRLERNMKVLKAKRKNIIRNIIHQRMWEKKDKWM